MPTKLIAFVVSALLSLGVLELGLRALTPFPIDDPLANRIEDPRLLYRMDPSLAGIDVAGYRNDEPMEPRSIVAIGDSHTYGYNVSSGEAWPKQLAEITGRPVYNMGVGGYGILAYRELFDEALRHDPEAILVGVYLANDLAGMCDRIELPHWSDFYRERPGGEDLIGSCEALGTRTRALTRGATSRAERLRLTVKEGSALGSALWHLGWSPLKTALQHRGYLLDERTTLRFADARQGTLFSLKRVAIHTRNMDLENDGIAGLNREALRLLREMHSLAEDRGVGFAIVMIPSRERVMLDHVERAGTGLPASFHVLAEKEEELTRFDRAELRAAGIQSVDLLPSLREALEREQRLYPARNDGHPLAPGYRAYAEGVQASLFGDSVGPSQ